MHARGTNPFDAMILVPAANGFEAEALVEQLREIGGRRLPGIVVQPACNLLQQSSRSSEGIVRLVKPVRKDAVLHALEESWGAVHSASAEEKDLLPAGNCVALRILLAEDNAVNQRLICRMLEKMGHAVNLAQHGQAALDWIQREEFTLVVMDMQMPVMDGLEATRRIRQIEKPTGQHVPIVALTANAFEEDRKLCLAAGIDSFLVKPVAVGTLREEITRHAEKLRKPADLEERAHLRGIEAEKLPAWLIPVKIRTFIDNTRKTCDIPLGNALVPIQ